MYDVRVELQKIYGWNSNALIFTWVHDKQIIHLFNSTMTVKELNNHNQGVCLVYECPQALNPQLPPITQISKVDSNMGIAEPWTKVVLHTLKDGYLGFFNLPRILWVKKDWTLQELHWNVFNHFKELMLRWYKDLKESGSSRRCFKKPKYMANGKVLDCDTLIDLFSENNLQK